MASEDRNQKLLMVEDSYGCMQDPGRLKRDKYKMLEMELKQRDCFVHINNVRALFHRIGEGGSLELEKIPGRCSSCGI